MAIEHYSVYVSYTGCIKIELTYTQICAELDGNKGRRIMLPLECPSHDALPDFFLGDISCCFHHCVIKASD